MSRIRASKSARQATALSLYTSQTENGVTILNSSLRLERFTYDEAGPFAELRKIMEEQHQGPPIIPDLPKFEQIAQKLASVLAGQSKDSVSGSICDILTEGHIDDIHSLSRTLLTQQN